LRQRIQRVGKLLFDLLEAHSSFVQDKPKGDGGAGGRGQRCADGGRPIQREEDGRSRRTQQQHNQRASAYRPFQPRFGDPPLEEFDEIEPGQQFVPDRDGAQQVLAE
jgi:hypothetical protein